MNFLRTRTMSALLTLGAGALIGVLGALSGKFDGPVFHVVNLVFSGGWSWACFAFLVGYTRKSKVESACLASSALAVGVVVYYLLKWLSPVAPIGMTGDGMVGDGVSSGIFSGELPLSFSAPRWASSGTWRGSRESADFRSVSSFRSSSTSRRPPV